MTTLHTKGILLPSGFRVSVTTAGNPENPPLVFLHGLTVSARAYADLIEELAEEHGWYVIAPDAPNHGDSGSLPWGHSISDIADILSELVDELDIVLPVIVGHSMGGGIAVEFAHRYPWAVRDLILLDAAAGKEHHDGISVKPGHSIPVRALRIALGGLIDVAGDSVRAWRNRTPAERRDLVTALRASVDGFRFVRTAKALMDADTEKALDRIRRWGIPTTVVHGELDQIIPLDAGISTAAAANAELLIIQGGFHSWMLADPVLAADVIDIAVSGVGRG